MKSNGISNKHTNISNKRLLIQNILFPNVRLEIFINRPTVKCIILQYNTIYQNDITS